MIREEAKQLLPIIKAFSEGKEIQIKKDDCWIESPDYLNFNCNPQYYRIKPEPKYRPFQNSYECWDEMQKHQPFGWVKTEYDSYYQVTFVGASGISLGRASTESYKALYESFVFADGTPFGIKEEESNENED